MRVTRICWEESDYDIHAKKLKQYFSSGGYNKINLQQTIGNVKKLVKSELLNDKIELPRKDPQTVFICTWHPKL